MSNPIDALKATGFSIWSKLTSRSMFDAIIAAVAVVASSDGEVTADEKKKLVGCIQGSELFTGFSLSDIIDSFNKYTGRLSFDFDIGKTELMSVIQRGAKDKESSRLIVAVANATAKADGTLSETEKAVVREIAALVNVPSPA